MKNKFLSIAAIALLSVAFSACSDDDEVKQVLITTSRSTGQFFEIDPVTGNTKPLFKITYNGETLFDIRSVTYHEGENKYYVSTHSYSNLGDGDRLGQLYSVDPATKVATMINDNDGKVNPSDANQSYSVWDAIVSWAVDADDSLIAVGDFNGDGSGFVKFATDGKRGKATVQADVCCGLGMIYDANTKTAILGNANNQDDAEVIIETFDVTTGESLERLSITDFEGFPESFNEIAEDSWMPMKGLARDLKNPSAKIYGLMFNDEDESKKTYFVEVDITNSVVKYISTIGVSNGDQYNVLSYLPSNKL